jgi:tripartite-type tricarboxylate transporter receptor subunit TctC
MARLEDLMRRQAARFFAAVLASGIPAAMAADPATTWPSRPVRLVVPFAPGGATDIVARISAQALTDVLGQQFVVDNRSGAAGNIGVEIVARAQPDGYTLLVGNVSTNAINPTAFRKTLKFEPLKDLTPVAMIAAVANVFVSGMAFPPNTMKDLVEYARARPGALNYSNPIGAYSHLDMLDFSKKAGIQAVNIPSKGAGASIAGVIAGEIHFSFLNAATVTPQIRGGRMKGFATTAAKRLPELPDVPTMAETGYPGIGSVNWSAYFVPAKTPPAIVAKLYGALAQGMQRPAVREAFARANVPVTFSESPMAFRKELAGEVERWARIIDENTVRFE